MINLLPLKTRAHYAYIPGLEKTPVALGFSRTRAGVGGVRNHLQYIKRYSSHGIALFPNDAMCKWAAKHDRWQQLTEALCNLPLERFRIVHSHVSPHFIEACRRASDCGAAWVHTYHTLYFPEHWGGQLEPWQERINRTLIETASQADIKISISPWLRDLLRDQHGIETRLIPNGVDVDKCREARPINETNAYQDVGPYVLFSGSLAEVKNPKLFIDLAFNFPELMFVMIGKELVAESVEPYFGKTLPKNLRLIGPVDHARALSFTRSASAVVVTSHSEGLPTVVMEAMAMSNRVVVPNSFGCKDLVENEVTGFLFEPNDLDHLTAQLRSALENDVVGQNAAELVQREYAWPQVVRQIDDVYSELLA